MESTGDYWVAAYEALEAHGLEVILANAREARAVPGRKSDVNDAQWLQRLHAAPTERFWGRLEAASLHGRKFATRREAMDAVLDWIAFYNHRRLRSMLGYLSPMQYEQRCHAAQRKKAA